MEPTEMKTHNRQSDQQQPFVSVIIPVFNDNESLRLCLAAIAQQTYPQARYEVIVVDNNSQESTTQVVDEFEGVVLVKEPQPGSYIARNRGLLSAQGSAIAFTDADCVPALTWLEAGVTALVSEPNVGLVGGPY